MLTMNRITGNQLGMLMGLLRLSENQFSKLLGISQPTLKKYLDFGKEPISGDMKYVIPTQEKAESLAVENGYAFTTGGLESNDK